MNSRFFKTLKQHFFLHEKEQEFLHASPLKAGVLDATLLRSLACMLFSTLSVIQSEAKNLGNIYFRIRFVLRVWMFSLDMDKRDVEYNKGGKIG